MTDRDSVWQEVAKCHPEFTGAYDINGNHHAVREIVLGGSPSWAGVHSRFIPCSSSRVMDIGANAGIYSFFCALYGASVLAFEPHAKLHAKLESAVEKSKLKIELRRAAVWTLTGRCRYEGAASQLEGCSTFNGAVPSRAAPWQDNRFHEEIDCISLQDAIGNEQWDCVKMDVEGAEFDILLETPVDALRRISFMYVEFHPWASDVLYQRTISKLSEIFQFEGVCENTLGRWEAAYLTAV